MMPSMTGYIMRWGYNSNLSRVRLGKHYLYDWLPQAKDWTMCASIDGTGWIGEFKY